MYFHPSFTKYYVTEQGEIYNSKTKRELKGTLTAGGKKISIRHRSKYPMSLAADRFIWEAYNGEDTSYHEKIIHLDGNKLHNKPNNLKMVCDKSWNPGSTEKEIIATNLATGKSLPYFDSIYELHNI